MLPRTALPPPSQVSQPWIRLICSSCCVKFSCRLMPTAVGRSAKKSSRFAWCRHKRRHTCRRHKSLAPKPTYDNKGKVVNKGIKYLVVGSSQFRSAIVKAAEAWNVNQDYKIRVVIQTETLTGYSLKNTYWKRLKTFREYWYNTLTLLSSAYFGDEGPFFSNIVLYGAIPAYKPIHDLDKLVIPKDVDETEDNLKENDEDYLDVELDEIQIHEESKRWTQK